MKRVLLLLVVILMAVVVYWVFFKKNRDTTENVEPAPLTVTDKSDSFNAAIGNLLVGYYEVKDAFVDWDVAKVDRSAVLLKSLADSLPLTQLKADSTIVQMADNYAGTISVEVTGILGEKDIAEKRKSFYVLSEALYELLRTVRYDGEVIYHQHCPMAFNDTEEAYWLSNKNQVVNPYLGNKHPKYKSGMLHCGDITDSLDFRGK
jgi:Protein of unknown function (DUF3347)